MTPWNDSFVFKPIIKQVANDVKRCTIFFYGLQKIHDFPFALLTLLAGRRTKVEVGNKVSVLLHEVQGTFFFQDILKACCACEHKGLVLPKTIYSQSENSLRKRRKLH